MTADDPSLPPIARTRLPLPAAELDCIALPPQLAILQVYRGIAATLVVLYHLTWYGGQDPPFLNRLMPFLPILPPDKPRPGVFLFGHSGVDFFFTLSGFVMIWGYAADAGKPRRAWAFLRARFLRIYPTYWAILALTLAYLFVHPGPSDHAFDPGALLRGIGLYGIGPFQVPPAETLPYELSLYFFFTSLLLLGWIPFFVLMAAWTVLIIGQSYYWMPLGYHPILLSLSMLEFLLGCLGALLVLAFRPRISPVWLWVVATGCLAIGVIDSGEVLIGSHHNIRNFALPYLALIVVGAGCELGGMRRFPGVLMLLGNASYSIYLSHYYLIWDLNGRVGSNPLVVRVLGRDGARILVCVLVLTLGVICWALIERPLHAFARRISRRSRRPVSATTAGGS